jgi:hypothetical protein
MMDVESKRDESISAHNHCQTLRPQISDLRQRLGFILQVDVICPGPMDPSGWLSEYSRLAIYNKRKPRYTSWQRLLSYRSETGMQNLAQRSRVQLSWPPSILVLWSTTSINPVNCIRRESTVTHTVWLEFQPPWAWR